MVTDPDIASLRQLPKIELHRHLEGSIRLTTVQELAVAGEIPLPADRAELAHLLTVQPDDPQTHDHFLSRFSSLREVFQSEAIVWRVVKEAMADLAADNVRYAELHVTPSAVAYASGRQPSVVLDWVLQAILETCPPDLQTRVVVSINRHEPLVQAESALQAAIDGMPQGVVGLDLAGDEARFPSDGFVGLFRQAKERGLKVSVHAGEWAGADSVRRALVELGADRIAHGIHVMEDKETVQLARDRRVPFTVCLTSNVQSGAIGSYASHPLPLMIQAGLQVSLNTDDPSISGTDLSQEYAHALGHLGLSYESLRGLILSAAQGSFLDPKERQQLEGALQRELDLAVKGEQE